MIREANEEDISKIIDVETSSDYKFRKYKKIDEKVRKWWFKEIKNNLKKGWKYFILIEKNKYLAYTAIELKTRVGDIGYLAVIKKYQGKGLGKKLMKHLEKYARKNNIKMLKLEVDNKNISAIVLYSKLNYIVHKIKRNHKLVMEKKVT
tara:strand:+ start:1455 stop:1901 length:447 start_codon:yes stop_codon:yes gene_type:complete